MRIQIKLERAKINPNTSRHPASLSKCNNVALSRNQTYFLNFSSRSYFTIIKTGYGKDLELEKNMKELGFAKPSTSELWDFSSKSNTHSASPLSNFRSWKSENYIRAGFHANEVPIDKSGPRIDIDLFNERHDKEEEWMVYLPLGEQINGLMSS